MKQFFAFTFFITFVLVPRALWSQEPVLPYYDQIKEITDPLQYSGFHVLVKPEVSLTIDFHQKTWTLHNIHQYDEEGGIILEQGRYGLCAELATYLYERLKKIIDKRYGLRFAMATEEGFFPTNQSNHIVLLMRDGQTQDTFLIDPSFHKYGKINDLNEYNILGVQEVLSFSKNKTPDVTFRIDEAMPLFIKEDILVSFAVTSVQGKFDKDNFLFLVSAHQRNKFSGLNVVMVGKSNGQVQSFEGKFLLESLLDQKDIDSLHQKFIVWLQQMGERL